MPPRSAEVAKAWADLLLKLLSVAALGLAFYVHATARAESEPLRQRVAILEEQRRADKEAVELLRASLLRIEEKLDTALERH